MYKSEEEEAEVSEHRTKRPTAPNAICTFILLTASHMSRLALNGRVREDDEKSASGCAENPQKAESPPLKPLGTWTEKR